MSIRERLSRAIDRLAEVLAKSHITPPYDPAMLLETAADLIEARDTYQIKRAQANLEVARAQCRRAQDDRDATRAELDAERARLKEARNLLSWLVVTVEHGSDPDRACERASQWLKAFEVQQ